MSNAEQVTISLEEYVQLCNSDRELTCIYNAGVDNWSGYSYAMEEFYSEDDSDE